MQCILMLYLDVYALLHTRQMYLLENSDRRIVINFCFLSSSEGFCGPCADAATPFGSGVFTTGATMAFTAAGTGVNSELGLGRVTHVGGGGGGGWTIIALTIGGGCIGGGGWFAAETTMFGDSVVGFAFFFSFAFFAAGPPPLFESSPPQ